MTPIAAALRASFAAQEALRGERVKYWRGGKDVELTALRGQTQAVSEDLEGTQLIANTVDWLVDPAELVIEGERLTPKIDDYLTDAAGRRYGCGYIAGEQVSRPIGNEADPPRLRIHTVEIEAASE